MRRAGQAWECQREWRGTWVGWPYMGHSDEPRMDELKKLLRRLDGLDGSQSLAKKAEQAEAQQRGYVGALRGAPVAGRDEAVAPPAPDKARKSSRSAIYVAAATAAVISTVTVYMMMTWQSAPGGRATGPLPSQPIVPSQLDYRAPGPGGSDAGRDVPQTVEDLVRQAERGVAAPDVEVRAVESAER